MHRCVKFSRATDKPCFSAGHIYQHKKVDGGSIKRDNEDFKKIKEQFKVHNPFACGENLLSLDSGK